MPLSSILEPFSPARSRLVARYATVAAMALLVLAVAWHIQATFDQPSARWAMPDLQVYRAAVEAATHGDALYEAGFTSGNLPWLYPPFAAMVLAPLGWLPDSLAKLTISLLSFAALIFLCVRSWRATTMPRVWQLPLAIASTALLMVSEPMQQNLAMGQVNVVLAALVLADVLLPEDHRLKGALIGVGAGIKLTPALVAVYYMLRGDWVAARRAAAVFLGALVVGAVFLPSDSWTYWTHAVLADRIGPAHLGNQSLLGAMLRLGSSLGLGAEVIRPVWLVAAGMVAVAGVGWLARSELDALGRYCGLAAVTVLVSPLSWTPHWISLLPMVIWVAGRRLSVRRALMVVVVASAVLFAWPVDGVWFGLLWTVYPADFWAGAPATIRVFGWAVVGNLYTLLGVGSLVVLRRIELATQEGSLIPAGAET